MRAELPRHEHHSADIAAILPRLVRARAPVTVRADGDTFSALISSVHLMQPHFTALCDAPAGAIERAMRSPSVQFVVLLGLARLEFSVAGSDIHAMQEQGTIAVALPKQMLRFDRRRHYRGKLPQGMRAMCELSVAQGQALAEIYDISLGGIGLICNSAASEFRVGEVMQGCRVRLPDAEAFSVDLEVRCLSEESAVDGRRSVRLGCQFLNLPAACENIVREFVARCE